MVKFKILKHRTENTGGGTMVGFATVYLPEENRTVFTSTNEMGMTVCSVEWYYIDTIEEYEPYILHDVSFDSPDFSDPWFDLARWCLNAFIDDTSPMDLPYELLADEIRNQVSPYYREWCAENGHLIRTDGRCVAIHPDYTRGLLKDEEVGVGYTNVAVSRALTTLSLFQGAYHELLEELNEEYTPLRLAFDDYKEFRDRLESLGLSEQVVVAIQKLAAALTK